MKETKKRKIVVCDLDGTISDARARVKKYLFDGVSCKVCGAVKKDNDPLYKGERCRKHEGMGLSCGGELVEHKKDYKGFYENVSEDKPMTGITSIVSALIGSGYEIAFVTGRDESCAEETICWIEHNLFTTNDKFQVYMRANYDRRQSARVKKDIIKNLLDPESIAFVLDDEPDVLEMYKKNCPNATIINIKNYLWD